MPGTPDEAAAVESTEVDDAFRALLEGLRTTLTGVQVLFAFLFILPLQASFPTSPAWNAPPTTSPSSGRQWHRCC